MKTIVERERNCNGILNQPVGSGSTGVEGIDTKVTMVQALIPMGLAAVDEALEADVKQLAGERH